MPVSGSASCGGGADRNERSVSPDRLHAEHRDDRGVCGEIRPRRVANRLEVGGESGFDFRSGGAHARTAELTPNPGFLPTQFVFTPLPFGRLLLAFLPLLVRLHLVASQYAAQVAFEAVLAIAQILAQILQALGVKHR